jgi:hypothetical protein
MPDQCETLDTYIMKIKSLSKSLNNFLEQNALSVQEGHYQ